MKKLLKSLTFALVLLVPSLAFGQTTGQQTLTQTTLSATVNGPNGYSGETSALQTQVTLASTTGITTSTLNSGVIQTYLYIDHEAMGVTSYNSTSGVVQVIRGSLNTQATPHASGTMVLIGVASQIGGNVFFQYDPAGQCASTAVPSIPWINVLTGNQWLCSSVTGTWVPGFGNPGNSSAPIATTAAVASAAGAILPSGPLFHVTGTSAITGFTIPVGCNATAEGGCSFTIIPDGVFTYTTAGNIGLASTGLNAGTAVVVVGQPITFVWDAKNSKFYPNTQ